MFLNLGGTESSASVTDRPTATLIRGLEKFAQRLQMPIVPGTGTSSERLQHHTTETRVAGDTTTHITRLAAGPRRQDAARHPTGGRIPGRSAPSESAGVGGVL